MTHEMILVDGVWECPACGRRVILDAHQFKVLEQGEFNVQHFGTASVPGVEIGVNVRADGQR